MKPKIRTFIEKYFGLYLEECRKLNPLIAREGLYFPPTSEELEEIQTYLAEKNLQPIIIGSLAVIKYMDVTEEDILKNRYRLLTRIEFFVKGDLPPPPPSWKALTGSNSRTIWISNLDSVVEFLVEQGGKSGDRDITIVPDAESLQEGCPIADLNTLFRMKLERFDPEDVYDLHLLANKRGIPLDLESQQMSRRQIQSFDMFKKFFVNKA